MAWRIIGGVSGWLASLLPLVIVNALAFTTALDPSLVPIAGAEALALGIALGGGLAGWLGGKRGAGWGGLTSGAVSALLFAATLIGLMYVLRAQNQLPYLLALHPVRTMEAIGFVACLVMGAATLVGALVGRRNARLWEQAQQSRRPSAPRQVGYREQSQPLRDRAPSQPASRPRGEYSSRERSQRW